MTRFAAGRWPTSSDYCEAVQTPEAFFADDELRRGIVARGALGLPLLYSGAFANVYRFECPQTGNSWAVKFFTREKPGLRERYQAISEHLRHARLPFMVDFHYLEQGVRIRGDWHPLVKLRWIEGFDLNRFVRDSAAKPKVLDKLSELWVKLAARLRSVGIAHADLQHGNALLVPRDDRGDLALRLIDYDGMWVPSLAHLPSGETGHRNYQHPRRATETAHSPTVDHFSHLVVCCALRCVRVGGVALWERFDNGDNLLFVERDFADPSSSPLFRELATLRDPPAHALVRHLALASRRPLEWTPWIHHLIDDDGNVRSLTADESAEARELLEPTTWSALPVPFPSAPVVGSSAESASSSERHVSFEFLPPPFGAPPAPPLDALAQTLTIAASLGHSVCVHCHALLTDPGAIAAMPTRIDERGDFVSSLVSVRRTKSLLMLEDEIQWQRGAWPFPQPAGHLPRSSIVALAAAVAGLAASVGILLGGLGAGLAGGCVIVIGAVVSLTLWLAWRPRADSVLAVVWDEVVPRLVTFPPAPEIFEFLAGLARTSERSTDAGREPQVVRATSACAHAFQEGRASYACFAALDRLLLIDALQSDGTRGFRRFEDLIERWRQREIPTACLDLATSEGGLLELLSDAERRRLKWRFLRLMSHAGLGPRDVAVLTGRSRTLHRLLHSPEVASSRFVTLALAAAGLPREAWTEAGAESVFTAAEARDRWFEHCPGPFYRSSDGEFEIDEDGLRFRGTRVAVNSRIEVEERQEFVQTGWTHSRRDGGPDLRYKHNPPVGYHRTVDYALIVDGRSWFYPQHPREVISRIDRWRTLSFRVLSPRYDEWAQRPPGRFEDQFRADEQTRCPQCGTDQLFVRGESGRATG